MKLGFNEPKKVIILAVLLGGALYLKFSDTFSSPSSSSSAAAPAIPAAAVRSADAPETAAPPARVPARSRIQSDDFHPVLHSKRPEDRIDPAKVDPTLRLDLLAKLQQVDVAGPGRNLFQFGPPPPPPNLKGPEPKILPKPVTVAPVNPAPAPPTAPPPPPRIPLRYYGYSAVANTGPKTAFFLDGEDILVAKEGETLKRRYRVVRIGATSVVMEDTESKNEQTIQMEPIPG